MSDLEFAVIEADSIPFAAEPTLLFKLLVKNLKPEHCVKSVSLRVQIRIEANRRQYDAGEEKRLLELFGEPDRWGTTVRSLLWNNAATTISAFDESSVVELPITCTYDFEVVSAKYFNGLADGEIPLLFLFSGTVFYTTDGGSLQISQIPWEKEARFRMPVRLWKETIDHYFPNCAWLRIRKDVFDRLYEFRTERSIPTWEDALENLLDQSAARKER